MKPAPLNVHVRLQVTQQVPGQPPRVSQLEVWWKDQRFHVRDRSGRRIDELIADVSAPRRLGNLPRTMEQLMDRDTTDQARAQGGPPPTELYGDLETDQGCLDAAPGAHSPVRRSQLRAARLAPIARQVLAEHAGLTPGATTTRLGRTATAYDGVLDATEGGEHYRTRIHRLIAPPYLLFEHNEHVPEPATDAASEGEAGASTQLWLDREILALDEGDVSDADVTPPASP